MPRWGVASTGDAVRSGAALIEVTVFVGRTRERGRGGAVDRVSLPPKEPAWRAPTAPRFGTLSLVSLAAAAVAGGVYLVRGLKLRAPTGGEHAAPDLALDRPRPGPGDRAPEAFRRDPTAPMPDSEREGLRPATGPVPTVVG